MGGSGSDQDSQKVRRIRKFYDCISPEYDDERDPWTDHYNVSTREFLKSTLDRYTPKRILDVGIGSGAQMIVYATQGAELSCIDLSQGMLRVASYKSAHFGTKANMFHSHAQFLPFVNQAFDFVVCCGSVLNYCPRPELVIVELARVLAPRGALVVGFDNHSILDYVWILFDAMTQHLLKYGIRINDAIRWFSESSLFVEYPYITLRGEVAYLPERFLSHKFVSTKLSSEGLDICRTGRIHVLGSLIPFTIVASPKTRPWLTKIADRLNSHDRFLRKLDRLNWASDHILIEGRKA